MGVYFRQEIKKIRRQTMTILMTKEFINNLPKDYPSAKKNEKIYFSQKNRWRDYRVSEAIQVYNYCVNTCFFS